MAKERYVTTQRKFRVRVSLPDPHHRCGHETRTEGTNAGGRGAFDAADFESTFRSLIMENGKFIMSMVVELIGRRARAYLCLARRLMLCRQWCWVKCNTIDAFRLGKVV